MDSQVIVVGGGPVGLTLSLGLAHHGIRSVVLECRTTFEPESRALAVWPRTIELLRDWNLWEPLRAAGTFSESFVLHNAATQQPLLTVKFASIEDVFEDPGYLMLPQFESEKQLRAMLAANPLCELRTGITVTGVTQGDGGVDVATDAGTLRARYVVGCDGENSAVRESLGLHLEGFTYKSRVMLSDEELDVDFPSPRIDVASPRMLFAARYGGSRWRTIAIVSKATSDEEASSEAAHQARLHALFGDEGARSKTLWRKLFRVHRRHAARFVVGRVLLAGDAAHVNSPAGGQGMNSGIHDAANLAWKLAAIFNGADEATLLQSYDDERREAIIDSPERFTDRLARLGSGFSRRLRRLEIGLLSRSVRAHGLQCKLSRALGMLNGRYTKSPIVKSTHPVAGRRVSDLLLPDGQRINAARAGKAAIVLAGDADVGTRDVLHIPNAPKRWHVKPPVALIVRPDGCVAEVIEKPTPERVTAAWNHAFALDATSHPTQ